MSKVDKAKLDFFNLESPEGKQVCEGMELLFDDILEVASTEAFGLDKQQLELFKEMIANQLYYNYTVVFSPIDQTYVFQ